jgi:hypothetical protein
MLIVRQLALRAASDASEVPGGDRRHQHGLLFQTVRTPREEAVVCMVNRLLGPALRA